MNSDTYLQVSDLHVSYGQIAALRGVSIEVARGETVCVVGQNGAGKSTLMSVIAGGLKARTGQVVLGGTDIGSFKPEDIARLGVSIIPEGRRIFGTLTVEENLKVASYLRKDDKRASAVMRDIMEMFPVLGQRRSYPAGRLSGGEQQMLAIGRAIMTEPSLIMVDEPSLGLAPKIVDQVYAMLDQVKRERGVTLLINEQSSTRIMKYATKIYVLRGGLVQLCDTADNLRDGEAIKRAYFGFAGSGSKQ